MASSRPSNSIDVRPSTSINNESTPLLQTSLEINNQQGTSWYVSIFLVINVIIGGGLLNFPQAFHQSGGILVAVISQIVLIILMTYSLIIFLKCAHIKNCTTYQDVILKYCGRRINYACSFFIFLYTFGSSVIFLIIIGDQWDKVMENVYDNFLVQHPWYLDRKMFITVSSFVLILPLCYAKRIDFLKYASSVGVLAVFYCVLLVVIKYYTGIDGSRVGPVRHQDYWPKHASDVFLVIPTICFAYQCHLSIVQIYVCTKNREVSHNFTKTIIISMLVCFAIYSLFAIYGYLTFGSCVQPDLLLSYKATPEVLAGVVSIALKMYMSYPIMLYIGRSVADDLCLIMAAKFSSRNKILTNNNSHPPTTNTTTATTTTATTTTPDNNRNNNSNHSNGAGVKDDDGNPRDVIDIRDDLPQSHDDVDNDHHDGDDDDDVDNDHHDGDDDGQRGHDDDDHATGKRPDKWELKRRVIITSAWFILSLLIALFVPDIDKVISFLGGVSVLFIFVLPGMCYLQYLLNDLSSNSTTIKSGYEIIINDDDNDGNDDVDVIFSTNRKSVVGRFNKYLSYAMAIICILLGGFIFGVTTCQNVMNDIFNPASIICS